MRCSHCSQETMSFYDTIGKNGLEETDPCCAKCFRKITKGLRHSMNGDAIKGDVLMRWFNREYKPREQIVWLFYLAGRTSR